MNSTCLAPCVPGVAGAVIPLYRPWWRRLLDAWSAPVPRPATPQIGDPATWHDHDLYGLRELSPQVLRDIGAPEWVHAGRSAAERAALDLWRL